MHTKPVTTFSCLRKHLKSVFHTFLKVFLTRLVVHQMSTFPLAKKNSRVNHAMISENMGSHASGCGHTISSNVQAVNASR